MPSERFFAGGGTTVRGFEQDKLGPLDRFGNPLGGNAMLVINNELRFPFVSILDAVGFVDIGNVYPKISDFSFSDLRETAGFGLRLRTPFLGLTMDSSSTAFREKAKTPSFSALARRSNEYLVVAVGGDPGGPQRVRLQHELMQVRTSLTERSTSSRP